MKSIRTLNQCTMMLVSQKEICELLTDNNKIITRDWELAIMMTASEALNKLNWQWWKTKPNDIVSVRKSLIKIWNFAIASKLSTGYDKLSIQSIAQQILVPYSIGLESNKLLLSLEDDLRQIIKLAANETISIQVISRALRNAGISWNSLCELSIARSTLDKFRFDNGYCSGAYNKDWSFIPLKSTIETDEYISDTDHLYDILKHTKCDLTALQTFVYAQLVNKYFVQSKTTKA